MGEANRSAIGTLIERQARCQFGEHAADDAGAPAAVPLTLEQAPLSGYRPGTGASISYTPATTPLVTLVESEPLDILDARTYAQRIEAAQHFMRLFDAHGATACGEAYASYYAWSIPATDFLALDDDDRLRLDLIAGRFPTRSVWRTTSPRRSDRPATVPATCPPSRSCPPRSGPRRGSPPPGGSAG